MTAQKFFFLVLLVVWGNTIVTCQTEMSDLKTTKAPQSEAASRDTSQRYIFSTNYQDYQEFVQKFPGVGDVAYRLATLWSKRGQEANAKNIVALFKEMHPSTYMAALKKTLKMGGSQKEVDQEIVTCNLARGIIIKPQES